MRGLEGLTADRLGRATDRLRAEGAPAGAASQRPCPAPGSLECSA